MKIFSTLVIVTSVFLSGISQVKGNPKSETVDTQVKDYIQATKLDVAQGVAWCDPIPDCDPYILKNGTTDGSVVIVVISKHLSSPSDQESQYLEILANNFRQDGLEVLAIAVTDKNFGALLKCRLLNICKHKLEGRHLEKA